MKLKKKLIIIFAGIALLSCENDGVTSSPADEYLNDSEALKRGRLLFVGTCAGYCHKLTPERSDAPYLFDCQWLHGGSDEEIYTVVTGGVSGTRMIAFGENFPESAKDLWKIIAFLKSNRSTCS